MSKRTLVSFFVCVVGLAVAAGCASPQTYQMQSGERTAGADGDLTITTDRHGNQLVELEVAHLTPPARLDEQKSTYTVWLRPDGSNQRYNVAQLRVDGNQSGILHFTTPFTVYDLKVTAEVDHLQETPSEQVVLRQRVGD